MPLRVKVIVEGQGDENAVRLLLERIWYGLLNGAIASANAAK